MEENEIKNRVGKSGTEENENYGVGNRGMEENESREGRNGKESEEWIIGERGI